MIPHEHQQATHLRKARMASVEYYARRRFQRDEQLRVKNSHLGVLMGDVAIAKLSLAMLYLGEGTKNPKRACVIFGNSDPAIILLYLRLFRSVYPVDESKFRCNILCRADQDSDALMVFWSQLTGIPLERFYPTRYDSRTIGKTTLKSEYKGVCCIYYLSAATLHDLLATLSVIKGPIV